LQFITGIKGVDEMIVKKSVFGWFCAASIIAASFFLSAAGLNRVCYDEDGSKYFCPK